MDQLRSVLVFHALVRVLISKRPPRYFGIRGRWLPSTSGVLWFLHESYRPSTITTTHSTILTSGVALLAWRAAIRGREAGRTRRRRSTWEALGTRRRHARERRERETAWWGEGQASRWWHGHTAGTGRELWETTATGSHLARWWR